MDIRPAHTSEYELLTDLTMRSKAFWGYSLEQMEEWQEELSIDQAYIRQHTTYSCWEKGALTGYYSCIKETSELVVLDNLFVDPPYIGKGIGKALLGHAIMYCQAAGYHLMRLYADPHAERFYLKHGFFISGQHPSSIRDRFLPIMDLHLSKRST